MTEPEPEHSNAAGHTPPPDGGARSPAAFAAGIAAFFAVDGPFARTKAGFEPRPGQLQLAQAIGAALTEQRTLLAEAGTGTGKTMAYLVPALLSRLKVVVSTATKQLQEQILRQDVPSLEAALGRSIDAVGMKGRTNYLCEARVEPVLQRLAQEPARAALAHQLGAWRNETATGERSEFVYLGESDPLWRELTATREQCTGRACRRYDGCWVVRMRRRAQEAELVVVNHHLFFADAAMAAAPGEASGNAASLLPPYEAVVFDEAHELDEVASQHFGHQVTERQLAELLGEVARRQEEASTLPDLEAVLARTHKEAQALFATLGPGGRTLLQAGLPEVHAERDRAYARVDDALAYLEAELGAHGDEASRQLGERLGRTGRSLAFVLGASLRAGLLHGEANDAAWGAPAARPARDAAQADGEGETTYVLDADAAGPHQTRRRTASEAGAQAAGAAGASVDEPTVVLDEDEGGGTARGHGAPTHAGDAYGAPQPFAAAWSPTPRRLDPFVRFGEVQGTHRQLAARPLDVAERMAQVFADVPCVFVSATLQLGDNFAHAQRRFGLANAETLALPSAFDFTRQAALYLPDDLPEPERDAGGAQAAARTAALCAASGGGALVLCTSHRALVGMARALRGAAPGPLLVQGDAPRPHLLRAFAARTDAVLLATLGFWRGVDVPGPALRLVVMDRVPFAVPTDPVVQARVATLAESGLDPFVHHTLPQAALLLRQGFGRLIRTQTDVGVVAILDPRLQSRSYGVRLLEALPPCPRLHGLDEVSALLRRNRPSG